MPKKYNEKEVYSKLLSKKGAERHKTTQEYARKKVFYDERLERLKQILDGAFVFKPEEVEEVEKDDLKILSQEIKALQGEIEKQVSLKEIKNLQSRSYKRLFQFMRERKSLLDAQKELKKEIKELQDDYRKETKERERSTLSKLIFKYTKAFEQIETKLKEISFKNPESFLAYAFLELRRYKKELPSGIVETDYPKSQKERAEEILTKSRLVGFLGETGTGKTRLARKIAEEMTGDYEFVPGHKFITAEDLFYYRGLDVRKISPSDVPEIIKREIERFRLEHPDLSSKEIKSWEETIKQVVQGQAVNKELVSEVFLSAVLKAANEGKIVIIDEFNYIPPALLGGLNALIEAKPNEEISVFGQKIKVKPGFGVILTGNITRSEFRGRYLQREKIDPALVNRLNSGLIEYGSLPQANMSFRESILSQSELKEEKEIPSRELFQIGLTLLADEKGNISGPKDLLERVWNLSEELSLLQKIYGGEKLETPVKLSRGQDVVLKEYAISNRTYLSILEHWKNDNYRYSIDWYVYDNLIRPASIISPSEAGQIFSLLKERGMFFQDPMWEEVLKVNPTNYEIEGIEEIERRRKDFMKRQELKSPKHYFIPKEVAEAFLGVEMPELEEIEEVKKELEDKERIERYIKLQERYDNVKSFIENLEQTIELYCQDEKNILENKK
jgi:MoxR-like ATPase/REP element-mobilizing transposase RayT